MRTATESGRWHGLDKLKTLHLKNIRKATAQSNKRRSQKSGLKFKSYCSATGLLSPPLHCNQQINCLSNSGVWESPSRIQTCKHWLRTFKAPSLKHGLLHTTQLPRSKAHTGTRKSMVCLQTVLSIYFGTSDTQHHEGFVWRMKEFSW